MSIIYSNNKNNPSYAWVSFADSKYAKTLKRISEEAKTIGLFDYMYTFNEKDLDPEFWNKHKDFIENNKRGYGYWIWKPYIIEMALLKIPEGCYLFHTDAGCVISANGASRALEYIKLLNATNKHILGFDMDYFESVWTKADIFSYFNTSIETYGKTRQIIGGINIFRNSPESREFIKKWRNIVENNYNLIDDSPSIKPNAEDFIENRHDQSIFSMLMKINSDITIAIPDETYTTNWITFDSRIPFQARRLKY